MNDGPVKRRYNASRRQAQARQLRLDVVAAARALFIERGFAATTIADVAQAADVSTQFIYQTGEAQRRTGDGLFVANLRRAGQLRSGLSDEQAADAIWALSPDILWNQLVIQRGWTPDQFEMWYAGQLAAAILDDKQIPAVRQFSRKLITATTPTPAATAGRVSDV